MKQRCHESTRYPYALWFDVESKYEATNKFLGVLLSALWFDVESKYEAT